MHHLGGKIASSEAIGNHHRVNGRCIRLDTTMQPPILRLGLLYNVMTGLVGLDGNHLLDEIGYTLGTPTNFLAGVVEFLESLGPGYNLLRSTVDHPIVFLFILKDAYNDRIRNGTAQIGGGDSVKTLVFGDVVGEPQGVSLKRTNL